jgi:cytoskeletal protein CcmA (bactofilin family)
MFSQNEQVKKEIETIIGPSVTVEGNFSGSGNVLIEGSLIGSLKTNGTVRVANSAKVKAEVKGNDISVSGEIRGNIEAKERVDLSSTARVFGNIETQTLIIEAGAFFQGKCQMAKEAQEEKSKQSLKPKS